MPVEQVHKRLAEKTHLKTAHKYVSTHMEAMFLSVLIIQRKNLWLQPSNNIYMYMLFTGTSAFTFLLASNGVQSV